MVLSEFRKSVVFTLLFGVLFLSACASMTSSDKPAVTSWWLNPYTSVAKTNSPETVVPVAVEVAIEIVVVPGLDTDQILTLSADAELKPYSGARWVDHLPELLTSLLGRTLEASGRFKVDSGRISSGPGPCELQLELREFFADLSASGQTTAVRVAVNGHYHCEATAPLRFDLSASIPVRDQRMNSIVAAFQQAIDNVMKDMLAQM
jgi:ABC-type uncharacterized transport system auxiliary subunit